RDFARLDAELAQLDRLAPKNCSGHWAVARACCELGDSSRAVKEFERALALEPENAEVRLDLASLLFDRDEESQALAVLSAGLVLRPHSSRMWHLMAFIQTERGAVDEAATSFKRARSGDTR